MMARPRGGGLIPNEADTCLILSEIVRIKYRELLELERKMIAHIEYLEEERDYKNGCYKYVLTEGEGEDAVSTTWYSWSFTPGYRKTCTMDGLIQMDLDRDAEREAERLPDDPQITPSTYYQTRIPAKCRLINYPDDLLPMTDAETEAWADLKQVQAAIKKYGITNEEDEENSNNEDSSEQ